MGSQEIYVPVLEKNDQLSLNDLHETWQNITNMDLSYDEYNSDVIVLRCYNNLDKLIYMEVFDDEHIAIVIAQSLAKIYDLDVKFYAEETKEQPTPIKTKKESIFKRLFK